MLPFFLQVVGIVVVAFCFLLPLRVIATRNQSFPPRPLPSHGRMRRRTITKYVDQPASLPPLSSLTLPRLPGRILDFQKLRAKWDNSLTESECGIFPLVADGAAGPDKGFCRRHHSLRWASGPYDAGKTQPKPTPPSCPCSLIFPFLAPAPVPSSCALPSSSLYLLFMSLLLLSCSSCLSSPALCSPTRTLLQEFFLGSAFCTTRRLSAGPSPVKRTVLIVPIPSFRTHKLANLLLNNCYRAPFVLS